MVPAPRLEESARQTVPKTYPFSRTVSAAALLPALKGILYQNIIQQHCIDKNIYLLGEQTDIPAAYAFKVSDLKLDILELNNSDSIESNIKKYQGPFKEGVNGVGFPSQHFLAFSCLGQNVPPATWCTLCWMKK